MLRRNGKASRQSSVTGFKLACIRFGRDRAKRERGKLNVSESHFRL